MKTKRSTTWIFALFAIGLILSMSAVQAGQSAKQAAAALPERLRSSIVKVSADNGTPDPPQWFFVCRPSHGEDGLVSITVKNGAIIQQKPSLDLRVALGAYSRIDLSKVLLDSRGAFSIAERYVSKEKGTVLANASYLLQQAGADATPIWSIWCYDASVKYIGLIKILASTGDVISWD